MPNPTPPETDGTRTAGAILAVTAIATIGLFLAHPAERATDFSGFLKEQSANQVLSTVVHGGFVVLVGMQLCCYAIFSGRLDWRRPMVVAGMMFFAIGSLIHMGAIFTDGVLTPALAARVLTESPDRILVAKALFVLCDIAAMWFGLLGMLFESAGIVAWGIALLRISRVGGIAGIAVGCAMVAALAVSLATEPHFSLLAIIGLIVWALAAGGMMMRRMV